MTRVSSTFSRSTYRIFCVFVLLMLSGCVPYPVGISPTTDGAVPNDDGLPLAYSGEFTRLPIDMVMATGQSVAIECQDTDAAYPYTPYDWPDAAATLEIQALRQ